MSFRRLLFLLPFLLAGCSTQSKIPAPTDVPVTAVPDDLGRKIQLQGPVERLIVLGPGATETVFALKLGHKIVGRDSSADFPIEAQKIAIACDYTGPIVEKCVALHPDLVIIQGETWDKSRVESWQKQIGAPVAALTATSLKTLRTDFLKMGTWLDAEPEAKKLAGSLDDKSPKVSVPAFVEIGRSPLWTAGAGTLVSDVMRVGGFSNVADDVKGYQPFGLESLLARQPAVYIAPTNSVTSNPLAELRVNPTLSKLKCIRDGNLIAIKGDYLLRPGPRLRKGIEQLRQYARLFKSHAARK